MGMQLLLQKAIEILGGDPHSFGPRDGPLDNSVPLLNRLVT